MEKMDGGKVLVFLDVSVNGDPSDRMIFELFTDVAPKTAENFRALCTGEKGVSRKTGKPLHYKGTFFHCIVKGHAAEAGDFLRRNGECGESIYSGKFPDEPPNLSHDAAGLLSMAICDRDEKGSLFIVTFKADQRLDRKRVVFGKLVDGYEVLKKMEDAGDDKGTPAVTVKIVNSGEFHDGIDKNGEINLKIGKHAVEENNRSAKRKEKHKKSSRKKRKRRKYYTSESDSLSDTDTEFSATDTDSESDAPFSLSDTSSSSDDRRKRQKRSRRDRHKHARKKDRRHEKRRRRREKRKRKSKRDKASDIENNKKSRSSTQDDVLVGALDVNPKHADERENENVGQKRSDAADRCNKEDEFARENGHHQNNNKGVGIDFERGANRHPDIVDDVANKSRSGSLSPRRTKGQSMSMLPMPGTRKSPCVAPNRSPSPSISPSPRLVSQSKSMTPARSENSRSPVRSTREMSARMKSPARSRSIHSRSRGATYSPPRVSRSPPRASSKRSSLSRSLGKPSRRSLSRSPVRSVRKSLSRRSPSPSAMRRPRRAYRRSRSGSPVSARRVRSPVSDRGRSRSRTPSVDGSPKRVWRGRRFSDNKYGYVRRYRSRSPDRSPVRSYRYGGRGDRDRYRRSPRRYRSPPRTRTPPRYRVGKRSRTRSRSLSRSPIRYRGRRSSMSRSPVRSRSPAKRTHSSSLGSFRRPHSLSPSRSPSRSPGSSPQSPQAPPIKSRSRSLSDGSPPSRNRTNLVSYGDGSPDSGQG